MIRPPSLVRHPSGPAAAHPVGCVSAPRRRVELGIRLLGAFAAAALLVLAGVRLSVAGPDDPQPPAPSRPLSARSQPADERRSPAPVPRPPRAAGASGMPWASGVFSHDAGRTRGFEQARGRLVDVLAVFPTRDSWDTLLDPWWLGPTAVPEGFAGTLNVGLPLFPADGSFEAAASGAYDEQWRRMGALIASRHPDAWVRPGWEMNIPGWAWSANPGNVEQYKQAFRRAATGLRAGGPNLRITFNPNEGRGGSLPDARDAYPGDEYVDDVGIDAYDWYPGYTGSGGWAEHRTKEQGWDFWAAFARERGKTFSVPEWGVMTGSDASGGDNPEYITAVLTWMHDHADLMSFDTYFEETADYCRCALSLNPRAQAAYTAKVAELAGAGGDVPGPKGSGSSVPVAVPADPPPTTAEPTAAPGAPGASGAQAVPAAPTTSSPHALTAASAPPSAPAAPSPLPRSRGGGDVVVLVVPWEQVTMAPGSGTAGPARPPSQRP